MKSRLEGGTRATAKSKATEPGDITEMLVRWSRGDTGALDPLTERVYQRLHHLASQALAREQNQPLDTTELVHEAYLKMVRGKRVNWQSRAHFFAFAAHLIREILVDLARKRNAAKRISDSMLVPVESIQIPADVDWAKRHRSIGLLSLHQAIEDLSALDEVQARIVELRFFAGMTVEETAEVLQISPRTVKRDWRVAKAWLRRRLEAG
jgi:RNA polymerase sigma factor (TIGR02999 family)